jgi:hypothetical protein
MRICIVENCERAHRANGYCQYHYLTLNRFGLTPDDYSKMLESQNGVCAICENECNTGRNLAIDHDRSCCSGRRSCGKCIRGLLCGNCNNGLGRFKDDINLLNKAIQYLQG